MIYLTIKQENFCNFYVESGNASDAYRRAYSCASMKPETINRKAKELLDNGKITARIEELRSEQRNRSDITKEQLLSELSNIAFSSIADMHTGWVQRTEFDRLTPQQKAAIKSISTKSVQRNIGSKEVPELVDVEYVKVELHDKLKAIERICKMLGYDAPEKKEVSGDLSFTSFLIASATDE